MKDYRREGFNHTRDKYGQMIAEMTDKEIVKYEGVFREIGLNQQDDYSRGVADYCMTVLVGRMEAAAG